MRLRVSFFLLAACLLGLSMPVFASTVSTQMQFGHVTKLANVNLKPGNYRFVANESTGEVKVERSYRVVARVKGKWVKLGKKSQYSEVLLTNHKIQEIRFGGKKRAVKFSS
jgi:hypothetical protein